MEMRIIWREQCCTMRLRACMRDLFPRGVASAQWFDTSTKMPRAQRVSCRVPGAEHLGEVGGGCQLRGSREGHLPS
eukprot:6960179-Pyramimonas_sp.AAC.1